MQFSFSLNDISCERDERILFSRLSYHCESGALLQVLGFNGAGKTTLLHTICGLRAPATGEILWQGHNIARHPADFKQSLFFLGHQVPVKGHLTVRENVHWLHSLHPAHACGSIDEALRQVDLSPYADIPCHSLSAGQRRRVALAQVYLTECPLWVLDEPFTAIDAAGTARLCERLSQHTARGGLVILTSHQSIDLKGIEVLDLADFQPPPEEQFCYG